MMIAKTKIRQLIIISLTYLNQCPRHISSTLYTLVFPAGLVNIQDRLGRNVLLVLFIRPGQSIVAARYCIAKMTSSDIDVRHRKLRWQAVVQIEQIDWPELSPV